MNPKPKTRVPNKIQLHARMMTTAKLNQNAKKTALRKRETRTAPAADPLSQKVACVEVRFDKHMFSSRDILFLSLDSENKNKNRFFYDVTFVSSSPVNILVSKLFSKMHILCSFLYS